jgi:hypothetical protein
MGCHLAARARAMQVMSAAHGCCFLCLRMGAPSTAFSALSLQRGQWSHLRACRSRQQLPGQRRCVPVLLHACAPVDEEERRAGIHAAASVQNAAHDALN